MKRILFVEDDALIASTYGQRLADEGFEVAVAGDGLAAMRGLPEFKPDLVVLDLLMPKMSGMDVLTFMRQRPEMADTRVVVFSNMFISGDLIARINTLRVDKMLTKSNATPAALAEAIQSVFASEPPAAPAPKSPDYASSEPPAVEKAPELEEIAPKTGQGAPKESGTVFQSRIQREFLERIPVIFKGIRQIGREFVDAEGTDAEAEKLDNLARKIGFLTQMVGTAGYHRIAELCSALEAMLFELREKPALINDSCRNTIASTVAFLDDSLDRVELVDERDLTGSAILVVDDDAVSNKAFVFTLGRAKLSATSVTDPVVALGRLQQAAYDLLLLDINMPGMDGLALCEQIRALPMHRRTPVIFVTSLTDFKTRARAILSGGNDLITKPILPAELCVKVITQLLKAGWQAPKVVKKEEKG
jgi:CheY-like chemotaxis protein